MPKSMPAARALREWMDVFMHRSMRGWNRFARATGLSMPQVSLLMQLHYKGACGVSEISQRFDITAAAASQLADKLVQSGHLERLEDPHDRRARQLKLSARGAKLVQDGLHERYRWMESLTESLAPDEQKKVGEALAILTQAAQKLDSSR